ncbi:MAG: anthranilate synthase component I family protein [Planctomycetia bacterium]
MISQGVPAKGPAARQARATERLDAVLAQLGRGGPKPAAAASTSQAPLPPGSVHPLPGHPNVFSTHTPDSYREMVRAGVEFVRAGDIFQVNLAQRLAVAAAIDPVELHLRARAINPAPFAGYLDTGAAQIASMSPERFLQVARGTVRMHPIKGTRRVIATPEADLYAGDDLGASAKDRAENVMIVDLVRNDLARVCTPESVRVEALCRLERYRYVQHLVSIVAGRLRAGLTAIDALDAAMPGGSVTGAPKHRACEIITSLEGVARGAYCGSLGYVGFDGTADFNLLIRTFVASGGTITFAAGGGITAASDPAAEHAESLHKAEGMLRVLESFARADGEPPA